MRRRRRELLDEARDHGVSVGELAQLHGSVGSARVEASVGVGRQVRHSHADVTEQRAPRVLVGKRVQQHVHGQAPHLK